jgi:hypothetical protein
MQRKMSNDKITKREISFPTSKTHFFSFFFSIQTPPTFKPHNFLISYSFKMFLNVIGTPPKVLQIFLNFNNNRATYKQFFLFLGTDLYNIWWFVFLKF